MLEGLRATLKTIKDEVIEGVDNLRKMTGGEVDDIERLKDEIMDEMIQSTTGSDLLRKYMKELDDIRNRTNDNIHMADVCTTRMGRIQQLSIEKGNAFIEFESFLRDNKELKNTLHQMEEEMKKLIRFCEQTEHNMTYLEGLSLILESESKVDEIRARSGRLSQVISPTLSTHNPPPRHQRQSIANEEDEQIILEQFLSSHQI